MPGCSSSVSTDARLNPSNIRNRDHLPRLVRLKMARVWVRAAT